MNHASKESLSDVKKQWWWWWRRRMKRRGKEHKTQSLMQESDQKIIIKSQFRNNGNQEQESCLHSQQKTTQDSIEAQYSICGWLSLVHKIIINTSSLSWLWLSWTSDDSQRERCLSQCVPKKYTQRSITTSLKRPGSLCLLLTHDEAPSHARSQHKRKELCREDSLFRKWIVVWSLIECVSKDFSTNLCQHILMLLLKCNTSSKSSLFF